MKNKKSTVGGVKFETVTEEDKRRDFLREMLGLMHCAPEEVRAWFQPCAGSRFFAQLWPAAALRGV